MHKKFYFLAGSWRDSIFGSKKNHIKCKALFLQWNLKTCKFFSISNTEKHFDFSRKILPVAHRFLEDSLVAASDYYHTFQEWRFDKRKILSTSYKFSNKDTSRSHATVLMQNKSAFSYIFLPTFSVLHICWESKIGCCLTKGRRGIGKIIFIKIFVNVAGAAFIFCVTFK